VTVRSRRREVPSVLIPFCASSSATTVRKIKRVLWVIFGTGLGRSGAASGWLW
jgi:hypothetical protein